MSLIHAGIPWEAIFGEIKKPMNKVWRQATVIVLNELNGTSEDA